MCSGFVTIDQTTSTGASISTSRSMLSETTSNLLSFKRNPWLREL
jgi:hypothetical protein